MKIKDLINFLTSSDDPDAEVVVAYFQIDGTAELFDIEEVGFNNRSAQLEIYEAE